MDDVAILHDLRHARSSQNYEPSKGMNVGIFVHLAFRMSVYACSIYMCVCVCVCVCFYIIVSTLYLYIVNNILYLC